MKKLLDKVAGRAGDSQSRRLIFRLIAFWSILLIITVLMGFSIYSTLTRQIYSNMNEIMSSNIKFAESTYGVYINQMKMGMLQASVEPGIRALISSRDGQALHGLMEKWGEQRYYVDEWYAVDKDGKIITSYSKKGIQNLNVYDIVKGAFSLRAPVLGTQLRPDRELGERNVLIQYCVVPITDEVGSIIGAFITAMNLEDNPNIPDKILDEAGMYTIISAENRIISCNFEGSDYHCYFEGEKLPEQVYNTIKSGRNYIGKLNTVGGTKTEKQYYSAFRPIKDMDGRIIGSQGIIYSDSLAEATLEQIANFTMIIALLLLTIFSIILWAYFRINRILIKEKQHSNNLSSIKKFSDMVRQAVNEDDVYEIVFNMLKTTYKVVQAVVARGEYGSDTMKVYKTMMQEDQISVPVLEADVLKEYCWAIRTGKEFLVNDRSSEFSCKYFGGDTPAYICLPIIIGGKVSGIIQLRSDIKGYFTPELVAEIKMYIDIITPVISNLRLVESLNNIASTDTLTKIYNRRYLDTYLHGQIERAEKHNRMLSVIMLDIDFFKKFNDTYGHEAGDYVLIQFANTIKKNLRKGDIVARYGGEEFLAVLPDTDTQEAYRLAEYIRDEVGKVCLDTIDSSNPPKLACSLGISCYPIHGSDPDKLIQAADKALYEAKNAGRNNTRIYKLEEKAVV